MKVSAILGLLLASISGLLAADEPSSQKEKIERLNACLAESTERVAVLRDVFQATANLDRARLALLEDALLKVTRQKSQLEEQLVSQSNQLASYSGRPEIDRDQWVALNKKVLTLENELDSRDAALAESRAALLNQKQTAEQRARDLAKDLTNSQNTAGDIQEELENTQVALALANKRATDAVQAQKQSADLVSTARTERDAAKQSLATAIDDLKAGSNSRDALTAQVATLQQRLKAVSAELQDRETAIADRDTKLAEAVGDLKKAQEGFRKVEAEKLEREAGLLERSIALQAAQRDAAASEAQVAALENSLESERQNSAGKAKLQQEFAALQKERNAHAEELQRSKTELARSKQQLAEFRNEEESWQQTRVQILAEKRQIEQQLAAAQQMSSQMQRQLLRIDPIRYELNSADIDREQARVRDQVKTILDIFPTARFEISGHTCTLGSAESNKTLSEQRAKRLLDFLVADGVAIEQLSSAGYGEERPVGDNSTDAGRRQNRRVEIKVAVGDTPLLDTKTDASSEGPTEN